VGLIWACRSGSRSPRRKPPSATRATHRCSGRQARAAAAAGVRTAWLGQRLDYDAITLAAVIGREVPELTVGVSVLPIFTRHPLVAASAAQTAQAATHGRFRLGLGLGAAFVTEPVFGIPHQRPIARLREYLSVLRSVSAAGASCLTWPRRRCWPGTSSRS